MLLWGLIFFAGCVGLSGIMIYITELQDLLKKFIDQNGRLLDGMHEGLLILSKSSKRILFSNKPAQSLIKGALLYHKNEKENDARDKYGEEADSWQREDFL